MEYNPIEKIKEALKITRKLEFYEKMDLQNILEEAYNKGREVGYDRGYEDGRSDGFSEGIEEANDDY